MSFKTITITWKFQVKYHSEDRKFESLQLLYYVYLNDLWKDKKTISEEKKTGKNRGRKFKKKRQKRKKKETKNNEITKGGSKKEIKRKKEK